MANTRPLILKEKEKILVLIVDRDNDIEEATDFKTPIYGKDEVIKTALEFARRKPEDSDVNVIFGGLQLYEKLLEEGKNVEIAIVSGDAYDSVKADMKIREELLQLKKKLKVTSIIMVSDGAEDEAILPVLQSILPVVSVKRIVVEQWRGVEETYILIGRYIKKALFEPRFSKLFLGVPGLIILSLVALKIAGYLQYATIIAGLLLGSAMIIRGFNLEEKLYEYWVSSPIMFIASTLSSISLIIGVGLFLYSLKTGLTIQNMGDAITSATPFVGMSAFSVLVGKSIIKLLSRDVKVWRDIVGMVMTIIAMIAFSDLGDALMKYTPEQGTAGIRIAFFESGFVQILLAGIGITGVLTLVASVLEKKLQSE